MKEIVHLLEIMQTTDPGDEVVASCSQDSSPQPSTSNFQQTVVKNSSSLPVQSDSSNNLVKTPKKRKRNTLDKVWKYTSRKNQRWNKKLIASPSKKNPSSNPSTTERTVFGCKLCTYWCVELASFHSHLMLHKKTPCVKCSYCQFTGYNRSAIWNHIHKASKTDMFHKQAGVVNLVTLPADRYADYTVRCQLPSKAKFGVFEKDEKVHMPPAVGQLMSVQTETAVVCYPLEVTHKISRTKSATTSAKGDSSAAMRTNSSSGQKPVLATETRPPTPISVQAKVSTKEDYRNEKLTLKTAIDESNDVLKKRRLTLDETQKELRHHYEKISRLKVTFVEKYQDKMTSHEDNPIADVLSSATKLRNKLHRQASLMNREKMEQELKMRISQLNRSKFEYETTELDETCSEYADKLKELVEMKAKEVQAERHYKSIVHEVEDLNRAKKAQDDLINEIEPISKEMTLLEVLAKNLYTKVVDLKNETDRLVEEQGKRIVALTEIKQSILLLSRDEDLAKLNALKRQPVE